MDDHFSMVSFGAFWPQLREVLVFGLVSFPRLWIQIWIFPLDAFILWIKNVPGPRRRRNKSGRTTKHCYALEIPGILGISENTRNTWNTWNVSGLVCTVQLPPTRTPLISTWMQPSDSIQNSQLINFKCQKLWGSDSLKTSYLLKSNIGHNLWAISISF